MTIIGLRWEQKEVEVYRKCGGGRRVGGGEEMGREAAEARRVGTRTLGHALNEVD
jgi:hypothetical protein